MAEHFLDLLIGRELAAGGTFLDDLPFFIGDIVRAPAFDLADEPCDPLLILGRLGRQVQHLVEDVLHLLFGHGAIIPDRPKLSTAETWGEAGPISMPGRDAGSHRLSTAGSQVAIVGKKKISTRIRTLMAM
jgi:hypothetical protein